MEVPELFMGGCFSAGASPFSPEKQKPGDHFTVDDLLDFSNEDAVMTDGLFDNVTGNSNDSTIVTAVDSCNSANGPQLIYGNISSRSFGDSQYSSELCVPHEELAELEWLSNFVDDSFSAQHDLQAFHFLSGLTTIATKPQTPEASSSSETLPPRTAPFFQPETPLPGKARSKRSRAPPCDWSTRLLHLTNPSELDTPNQKPPTPDSPHPTPSNEKETNKQNEPDFSSGRKCVHCASDKTPQWRTGPMGPKTLCNACGVRYKSGRLVPEYRPAASPTFISAKHSNSHRKVLELRRQKELQRAQHQQFFSRSSIFGVPNGSHDDYLIHHHTGPDFRHLI